MTNQTVTIMCLRETLQSGALHYPLFIGFVSVAQVAQIAEAPSFDRKTTTNEDIADNILNEPIRDWQRPIDESRVQSIADVFSRHGEFMPNPVLLAGNVVNSPKQPAIEMQAGTGVAVYKVTIEIPDEGDPKPLWILDGQHRIAGLNKSAYPNNPIPVVLLLDQSSGSYTGRVLAKIFAQVTTEATKLHPLHNEWLTYAFDLDKYSDSKVNALAYRHSMECVAKLCRMQNVGTNSAYPNAFFNQIKFSDSQDARPLPGGFYYDCVTLSENVAKYYYLKGDGTTLNPDELAEQIALAHQALTKVVPQPQNQSVFFGDDPPYYQKIMADAFLAGVLEYVRVKGRPTDWQNVLRQLKFDHTDWNFARWCKTLGGQVQTTSKKMAETILMDIFRKESLPDGTDNLADYLQGDQAKIEVICSRINSAGRPLKSATDIETVELSNGKKLTRSFVGHRHIMFGEYTSNIGKIVVYDKQRRGHEPRYKELQTRRGLLLSKPEHDNPLELEIELHHYGGTVSTAELTLTWE